MKYVADHISGDGKRRVLDVGCGDGRFCQVISSYNCVEKIKGIDLSDKAIRWSRAFNPDVEFEVEDVADEKEKWDAISAIEVFEHISDQEMDHFIQGISSCLDDDGRLYITVPSMNVPVSKKHYRHYTPELLKTQIESANCGLIVSESYYIVPNRDPWSLFFIKLTSNRLWTTPIFDKIVWKRLWKNGLRATKSNGAHVFGIVEKVK